ncbi:toll/interleukin-1 receptor domain-containing protein [Nocardia sp. alder85J]|uniref:toll/interleukin-1 receptor domain-containing protein n=1 Tax=Nocardia sp. alder85J TaxID=2862949 RepID=UPI001CD6B645|nr:toll/interleukin-1 receptor domain-containing protein [Nocardia sp. alder85J]MCX4090748.1 toll/interleukin-1 receptor domain-containing protein [Nocardia sp. alder85J]
MTKIFLSYRIVDSAYAVREISNRMAERIGRDNVFRDDDSLALGTVYAQRIRRALEQCDMVVAVIGPQWLDITDEQGHRRIDNGQDWVRYEIRTAYEKDIPVIPVLLDDTPLPPVDRLPGDIRALGRSQFWPIRHRTMDTDITGLLDRLLPDTAAPGDGTPPARGHSTQINHAEDNSSIVANNGGTQHITIHGDPRGRS